MTSSPGSSADDPRARAERLAARLPDANGNAAPVEHEVAVLTVDDAEAARRAWDRREVFSVRMPPRAPHLGHPDYEPGTPPEVVARDQARQRRNLRAHRDCAAAPESARTFARQELARRRRPALPAGRRTPPPRPVANRPRARRRAGARSGTDPPGESDEPEPAAATDLAPGRRRLTFGRFRRLTLGLAGGDRLVLFGTLPADAQDACWRDLERSCAEQIDRELEARR